MTDPRKAVGIYERLADALAALCGPFVAEGGGERIEREPHIDIDAPFRRYERLLAFT